MLCLPARHTSAIYAPTRTGPDGGPPRETNFEPKLTVSDVGVATDLDARLIYFDVEPVTGRRRTALSLVNLGRCCGLLYCIT